MPLTSLLVDFIQDVILSDPSLKKRHGERFKKILAYTTSASGKTTAPETYLVSVPSGSKDSPMSPNTPPPANNAPTPKIQAPANKAEVRPDSPAAPMDVIECSSDESSSDEQTPSEESSSSSAEDGFTTVTGGKRKAKPKAKASKAKKPLAGTPYPSPSATRTTSPLPTTQAVPQPPAAPAASAPATSAPATSALATSAPATSASTMKPKRPPPVYLQDKAKWNSVSSACAEQKISTLSATSCLQGIRIQVPTSTDFRSLTRLLKNRNISFHTYSLPEETPTRVVIRRIPKEISTEDIRADLISQNIPVTAVHRLHKARGGQVYDMVLVVCARTEGHNPIFGIKSICSLTGISIERPYRPTLVGQCHRCQLYGHSQANCFATPRCVKCLGEHGTQDCTRPKDQAKCTEPPSCVLCGQVGHPANYRGCPKAPKLAPKLVKRFDARQQRESPSVSVPSSQLPHRLAPQRSSPWNRLNHQRAFPALVPQSIPALMDLTIPAPTQAPNPVTSATPAAPKPTNNRPVAPTTKAVAPLPTATYSDSNSYISVGETIFRAYSIWVTAEARALRDEINKASPLNSISCLQLYAKFPTILAN